MKYEFIFIIHISESFPRQLEKWIENVQVLEKGDPKKVHGRVTICRLTKFFSSDETLVSSCTLCTATWHLPCDPEAKRSREIYAMDLLRYKSIYVTMKRNPGL